MRRTLTLTLAAAVLSGCVATQKDILDLSQQTDSMNLQVHQLKKLMSNLQANQADLNIKLEQVGEDIAILNENLADNRNAMSSLSSKMDDVGAALGTKFSSLDTSIRENRELLKEREARNALEAAEREKQRKEEEARKAEEEAKRQEEESRRAQGPSPSQIYHKARVQLSQKKYDMAAEGFKLYIAEYPKGEVADLATYYLGQVRYAEGKWELAARNFALVLDRYPKSDVTPAARLRYALSLMKMKTHLDEAKRYLESIPEDFAHSPEAKKAKEILQSWEEKKKETKKASPETKTSEKNKQ